VSNQCPPVFNGTLTVRDSDGNTLAIVAIIVGPLTAIGVPITGYLLRKHIRPHLAWPWKRNAVNNDLIIDDIEAHRSVSSGGNIAHISVPAKALLKHNRI
jgi:hypothetical protein